VQSFFYWSSTTHAGFPDHAWGVGLLDGDIGARGKDLTGFVWPVRGGE
jgi:hypothetical protein